VPRSLNRIVSIEEVEDVWSGSVEVPSKCAHLAQFAPFEAWEFTADELGNVVCDCGGLPMRLRDGIRRIRRDAGHDWHANYLRTTGRLLAPPIIHSSSLDSIDGVHRIVAAYDSGTGLHVVYWGRPTHQ
jgi:hypothetical protein